MEIATSPQYYDAVLLECQHYAMERMSEEYERVGNAKKVANAMGVSETTIVRAAKGTLPTDIGIIRKVVRYERY